MIQPRTTKNLWMPVRLTVCSSSPPTLVVVSAVSNPLARLCPLSNPGCVQPHALSAVRRIVMSVSDRVRIVRPRALLVAQLIGARFGLVKIMSTVQGRILLRKRARCITR